MNAASRAVAVLSTLLAVGAWAQYPQPPAGHAHPPAAVQQGRSHNVDARLQRAETLLESALNRGGDKKRALREALEEITAARAELAGSYVPAPAPHSQLPRAIRADAFNALVAALDRESNPEDQLRVLSNAAEGNLFAASQVQTVMARFSYDAFRLRAAGMLTRRLIDPGNAFVLYGSLNGAFDKQVMQQLIAGGDATSLVVAATDAQLRTLTGSVFHPWSPAERLSVLSARAGDQLLTAAQLRRVLDAFSTPRDRLTALQTMKRRLVDPRNAEVIAQAFWSPADQREARRLLGA
jgi:hypothetical protein